MNLIMKNVCEFLIRICLKFVFCSQFARFEHWRFSFGIFRTIFGFERTRIESEFCFQSICICFYKFSLRLAHLQYFKLFSNNLTKIHQKQEQKEIIKLLCNKEQFIFLRFLCFWCFFCTFFFLMNTNCTTLSDHHQVASCVRVPLFVHILKLRVNRVSKWRKK